jgi:hypothetical protein
MKTEYFKHSFKLSDFQIKNIISAVKANEGIHIRLTKDSFKEGHTELALTKKDAENVINNKSFLYNLNKAKMKFLVINEKTGGFLPIPILLGIIGGLATLSSAGSTIAKTVLDKKANDLKLEEEQRHNLELKRSIKAAKGEGVFLQPWKSGASILVKDFVKSSGLDAIGQKTCRCFLKNLYGKVKIEKYANGIYLSPLNM